MHVGQAFDLPSINLRLLRLLSLKEGLAFLQELMRDLDRFGAISLIIVPEFLYHGFAFGIEGAIIAYIFSHLGELGLHLVTREASDSLPHSRSRRNK